MTEMKLMILILLISQINAFSQSILEINKLTKTKNIKLDGKLNETIWIKSLISDKLYFKENNSKIDDKSKVFLTYDNKNIYIGFDYKTKQSDKVDKTKFDKDDENILSNEWVAFSIDTYNDGVAAYTFFVDAAGNQFDGTLNSSKDLSNSFSTKWKSAISYNKEGFSVEMKIPLITLPIKENKVAKMGVLFVYNEKQNGGEFQFPFIEKDSKNKIDKFQKVVFSKINLTHPKNLSGVNIWDRLAYKAAKINLKSLEGRSKGGDASVMDYYIFKKRIINSSNNPVKLHYSQANQTDISKLFLNTDFMKQFYPNSQGFETFLERSQTSAFIVLQNDTVLYEKYFNGFNKDTTFTSFSVAKSIVSILVGLAIKDGFIKSEDDKITEYIPELGIKDIRFKNISIKDLLSMSSGISYTEDGFPSDDDYTYNSPDLKKMTINNVKINEEPNKHWHYNNYNPILLGIILERVSKESISKYLEEKLWIKIGTQKASWSLDENGFEKMESGFNCIPLDYAKIGLLMLNNGKLNNEQILTKDWILKSTQPQKRAKGYYDFLSNNNTYYQYFWWGKNRLQNLNDYFAMGNKGEYIYINPSNKLIIIRLGFEYGMFTPAAFSWPELFYEFATKFNVYK